MRYNLSNKFTKQREFFFSFSLIEIYFSSLPFFIKDEETVFEAILSLFFGYTIWLFAFMLMAKHKKEWENFSIHHQCPHESFFWFFFLPLLAAATSYKKKKKKWIKKEITNNDKMLYKHVWVYHCYPFAVLTQHVLSTFWTFSGVEFKWLSLFSRLFRACLVREMNVNVVGQFL